MINHLRQFQFPVSVYILISPMLLPAVRRGPSPGRTAFVCGRWSLHTCYGNAFPYELSMFENYETANHPSSTWSFSSGAPTSRLSQSRLVASVPVQSQFLGLEQQRFPLLPQVPLHIIGQQSQKYVRPHSLCLVVLESGAPKDLSP